MTAKNPFLDPKKEIVQGKSDEQLREALERPAEEDTASEPGQRSSFSNDDYVFIPLSAFGNVSGPDGPTVPLPEYNWFREDGIYVAKGKLLVDDTVRAASNKLRFDLGSATDGDLVTPTWYEAKWLASALDGEMLTPSMLFCVIEHLKETGSEAEMLEDITRRDAEWLDAIVDPGAGCEDPSSYTRTTVRNDKGIWSRAKGGEIWSDGYYIMEPLESENYDEEPVPFHMDKGWFGSDEIERGFPERLHKGQKEYQYCPPSSDSEEVAVVRTRSKSGGLALSLMVAPSERHSTLGMRLCYTAEQFRRMMGIPSNNPRSIPVAKKKRKEKSYDTYGGVSWPPPVSY